MKIFNNPGYTKNWAIDLNLKLDDNIDIKRLLNTEVDGLIQIVFADTEDYGQMFVVTWDVIKNLEYSMIELQDLGTYYPYNLICKGMSEKLNYIITDSNFFDLFYLLPTTYMKSEDQIDSLPICVNERKLSKDSSLYLGMGIRNSISMQYTFLDLYYCQQLNAYQTDTINANMIFLEHFEPRYEGKTLFHQFALNSKILSMIVEEIKKGD